MSDGIREEVEAIAKELVRHLRWAQAKGEKELPIAAPGASVTAFVQMGGQGAVGGLPPSRERKDGVKEREDGVRERPGGAEPSPAARLEQVRADLGACTRCKLCEHRKSIVFGDGDPAAQLVFVGEGPGFEEDERGLPFVGAAGQLLDRMIEAMGYRRSEVYICNVIKCRPPGNRNPEPDEVASCEPFLRAQIAAIRPRAIVALGKFAAQTLLRETTPITRLRGSWREYEGIPTMPTFHPAYLLRNQAEKGKAWEDLQKVMALLGKRRP